MERRDFLTFCGIAGLSAIADSTEANSGPSPAAADKEIYELRHYMIASAQKQEAFDRMLRTAAVPAWNRLGIKPVGVFKLAEGYPDEQKPLVNDLFVLLTHQSPESVVNAVHGLVADPEFVKAAADVLDAPMKDPAYKRIETSLFLAFDGFPKLQIPSTKPSRIFQLRIYESHTHKACLKKIEMFNTGGELDIFRRVGLTAVFFGEALAGTRIPNLTYMLGFDDGEQLKQRWAAFMADQQWAKLKADPQYKDTVSNITNILLRPTAASQI